MARKPFFGSSGAPQIARMDMQSATAPGRMFQQSLTQLGQSIGGALVKHAENKEKKENQELAENFLISQGYSPEEAKVGSKVPEVNRFIMDMKKMDSELETEEANRKYLASQTKINETNLENMEEAEADQLSENVFMTAPSQRMPTKAEGRYSVLQNLRAGKGVTPPAKMIREDSPSVSQLPDSFKPFGRKVEDAIKDGQISPNVGAKLIRDKQAEAMAIMDQGLQLTEGEVALDKAFAEDLVGFNEADVNKGLDQLNEAVKELETKDNITGPYVSLMPDFVQSRVNPTATQVKEAVEEVVQRNLRLVLGAQFTEREGERLIKRAFNPSLPESENKKRVERLIRSIKNALDEKVSQRDYFKAYGTLKGYRYKAYTYAKAESDMLNESKPTQDSMRRIAELEKLIEEREIR